MKCAQKIADFLRKEGFTIQDYEEAVQNPRKKRLEFWKEKKITALIQGESKLIKLGEQVLEIMKRQ